MANLRESDITCTEIIAIAVIAAFLVLRQAQQADPNQMLWCGLTTATSTTKQMADAWTAALPLGVSGCWVTIGNKDQVKVAADFFRWAGSPG